jgi:hypothetical protein
MDLFLVPMGPRLSAAEVLPPARDEAALAEAAAMRRSLTREILQAAEINEARISEDRRIRELEIARQQAVEAAEIAAGQAYWQEHLYTPQGFDIFRGNGHCGRNQTRVFQRAREVAVGGSSEIGVFSQYPDQITDYAAHLWEMTRTSAPHRALVEEPTSQLIGIGVDGRVAFIVITEARTRACDIAPCHTLGHGAEHAHLAQPSEPGASDPPRAATATLTNTRIQSRMQRRLTRCVKRAQRTCVQSRRVFRHRVVVRGRLSDATTGQRLHGEQIRVRINNQTRTTKTRADGTYTIVLHVTTRQRKAQLRTRILTNTTQQVRTHRTR